MTPGLLSFAQIRKDHAMKLGIHVTNFGTPHATGTIPEFQTDIARIADDTGFATLSVMDHFFQIGVFATTGDPATEPMLESTGTLAFLAGQTSRLHLLAMVNGVTYRHPALLVKAVTTLDVLSRGRAMLGIGAAWNEEEHIGLGVPFPPLKERFERLEEALQIAHRMWNGDDSPFNGAYYQPQRPVNVPQSVQRPRPPILIGGSGEKKTLRLVAQYGDACNLFELGIDGVRQKLDVLRAHCETVSRPYAEIRKTLTAQLRLSDTGGNGTETPEQAIERLSAYAALGIDEIMFSLPADWDAATFERFATRLVPLADAVREAAAQ
jgi:F420-dependent oxidoreductase-like protein